MADDPKVLAYWDPKQRAWHCRVPSHGWQRLHGTYLNTPEELRGALRRRFREESEGLPVEVISKDEARKHRESRSTARGTGEPGSTDSRSAALYDVSTYDNARWGD